MGGPGSFFPEATNFRADKGTLRTAPLGETGAGGGEKGIAAITAGVRGEKGAGEWVCDEEKDPSLGDPCD